MKRGDWLDCKKCSRPMCTRTNRLPDHMPHHAHGFCIGCWSTIAAPERVGRKNMSSATFVEDYRYLIEVTGLTTDEDIAQKLGMKLATMQKARERARGGGVEMVSMCKQGLHPATEANTSVAVQELPDSTTRTYKRCIPCMGGGHIPPVRVTRQEKLAEQFAPYRPSDDTWKARARCRGSDDDFFPRTNSAGIAELKEVCITCPVRTECLLDALSYPDTVGVWGGVLFPSQLDEINPADWGIDE